MAGFRVTLAWLALTCAVATISNTAQTPPHNQPRLRPDAATRARWAAARAVKEAPEAPEDPAPQPRPRLVQATAASITATVDSPWFDGDAITVTWSLGEVPSPADVPFDFIAVYNGGEDVDVNATAPVRVFAANSSSTYASTGDGTAVFRPRNSRSTHLRVSFLRGFAWTTSAWSDLLFARGGYVPPPGLLLGGGEVSHTVVPVADPAQPLHPRLLPLPSGGFDGALLVAWTGLGVAGGAPTLQYGAARGALSLTSPGVASTLSKDALCEDTTYITASKGYNNTAFSAAARWGWVDPPPTRFTAVLTAVPGAAPGDWFYYRVGDAGTGVWSDVHYGRFPPAPGADGPFTFAFAGDLGVDSGDDGTTFKAYGLKAPVAIAAALARDAADGTIALALIGGDLSYGDGLLGMWEDWMYIFSPALSQVGVLSSSGNHEAAFPNDGKKNAPTGFSDTFSSGGECGGVLFHHLPMPSPATPAAPWYGTQPVGLTCFFSLSTEHQFSVDSPQWVWLQGWLQGLDRSACVWVVGMVHRPMYVDSVSSSSASKDASVMIALRASIEPLLTKYR